MFYTNVFVSVNLFGVQEETELEVVIQAADQFDNPSVSFCNQHQSHLHNLQVFVITVTWRFLECDGS